MTKNISPKEFNKIPFSSRLKGPDFGCCSICGDFGKLTWDHIPPKGCVRPRKTEITSLIKYLSPGTVSKPSYSQNGLCLRSICSICNNHKLGGMYDPALIDFSNGVARIIRSSPTLGIALPEVISYRLQPQRVARAVIGHVLATEILSDDKLNKFTPYQDALRHYFLENSCAMPNNLNIYVWIYPSGVQKAINNYLIGNFHDGNQKIFGAILKFYPLAFWVTWNQSDDISILEAELLEKKDCDLDQYADIKIRLKNVPKIDWPEVVDDGWVAMLSSETTFVGKDRSGEGFGKSGF